MSARRALVAALALLGAVPAVAAQEANPFYIGATFGQAQWRPGCPDSVSCDDTDWALRVLGGYTINRIFAAEIGYHNLGKATIKANAWEAVLLASWPIASAFSLYGKAGAYRGNAEGSGAALGAKETGYGGTWGFGAQFELTPRLALRVSGKAT
jgi:opacity protein-like surface antigen